MVVGAAHDGAGCKIHLLGDRVAMHVEVLQTAWQAVRAVSAVRCRMPVGDSISTFNLSPYNNLKTLPPQGPATPAATGVLPAPSYQ